MTTSMYRTVERSVAIPSTLSEEQYFRCCALAGKVPDRHQPFLSRHVFHLTTDEQINALQDYLVTERLPHRIKTARDWAPRRCKACPNPVGEGETWCSPRCQNADDPQHDEEHSPCTMN